MSDPASRLLSTILLMQTRPSVKASELARRFHVSERTILRDMDRLSLLGIPVMSRRGPLGGFSFMPGYRLPPLMFSTDEAAALMLGAGIIRSMGGLPYEDPAISALAKLENVLPDESKEAVRKTCETLIVDTSMRIDYDRHRDAISTLREAISERRTVEFSYVNAKGEKTTRKADPLVVVSRHGFFYLIAMCHLRGEVRVFRVDRSKDVRALNRSFQWPEKFSLEEYLREESDEPPRHEVILKFTPERAAEVRGAEGGWLEIQEERSGSITVTFGTNNLDWVSSWLFRFGGGATVIAPDELRDLLTEKAREILEQYAEGRG